MAGATTLTSYTNIVSSTMAKYFGSGKATDNIFDRTPLLKFLKDKAKLQTQGGSVAVMPIMGVKNTSFTTYTGYGQITPVVDEIITAAEYPWKQAAIQVPMSGLELAQNSGPEAVINLSKAKIENAEMTAADEFDAMFFTAGNTGNDWLGLPNIVDATGTVGTINQATDTWWASYEENTAIALSLAHLSGCYNAISYGTDAPDFQITTQTLYEKYESLLQQYQRFTDPKTAEAGFQNLVYRGSVVTWGDNVPAGEWYMLNSNHIKLVVLNGNWMKWRGWISPYDYDAQYGLVTCYGTLATDGRRYLGKLTAKTA